MENQSTLQSETKTDSRGYLFAFALITSLFFFWGFLNNLNPILIAKLRHAFRLNNLEAALVDSAVYIAYFVMAIPAGILMKKYGYKKGIIIGLSLFAIGCFLFIPAANTMQYALFLGALFIVACGLATLETAANPYATVLGAPETATFRLNLAQTFNGIAAVVAPLIGGFFILSENQLSEQEVDAMSDQARHAYLLAETAAVKTPYIVLGLILLLVAVVFVFTKLPDIKDDQEAEHKGFFHALKHKHLAWAVVAQFFYVGAQTCIISFLIVFATKHLGIIEKDAKWYAAIAGAAFMFGRVIGTFIMKYIKPVTLLLVYALICVLLCAVIIFGDGKITLYAMLGVAFFMSIMFPTIFALGISGIGSDTKSGSSLLVMSIVGGAILPPILGWIQDVSHNLQYGYIVPLVCFIFIAWYAKVGVKSDMQSGELKLGAGH